MLLVVRDFIEADERENQDERKKEKNKFDFEQNAGKLSAQLSSSVRKARMEDGNLSRTYLPSVEVLSRTCTSTDTSTPSAIPGYATTLWRSIFIGTGIQLFLIAFLVARIRLLR
jgi:hypothetical protein